jgi:putative transposase
VAELMARAQADGVAIGGEGALLAQSTKIVLESSLKGERDAHPGLCQARPCRRDSGNERADTRPATRILGRLGRDALTIPVATHQSKARLGLGFPCSQRSSLAKSCDIV